MDILSYRTVQGYGEETVMIKKSKFIGYAKPVETEAEAIAFVEEIRKKHWDATHNCYAYQIGFHDEIQKSSDDGEPAGTAGKPILEVIKKEKLKNVAVVVTRYFGGVLLGAGGLVRAYGQTAGMGLRAAGIMTRLLCREVSLSIDYTWLGKVEHELRSHGFFLHHIDYAERVRITLWVPVKETERLLELLADATNGQGEVMTGETLYASVDEKGQLVG